MCLIINGDKENVIVQCKSETQSLAKKFGAESSLGLLNLRSSLFIHRLSSLIHHQIHLTSEQPHNDSYIR